MNNFIFNGIHYLQKIGCAMGTICAPTYANIFMGKFERTFIYPCIKSFCNFYCRFIDDIFLLWNGSEIVLVKFIEKLDKCHATIKFDLKYSKEQIELQKQSYTKIKNKMHYTQKCTANRQIERISCITHQLTPNL